MALTKPTPQTAAPATGPATEAAAAVKTVPFETMDETHGHASAANDPPPVDKEPAAAASAAVAVVAPVNSAVAVSNRAEASAFVKEVEAMKGAANFDYGNYDVFKGINGNIKGTGDNTASLGRWVQVSMVAWDDRIQISPGVDTPSAKDCVAYSKDGKTIDSIIGEKYRQWVGRPVQDYIKFLKDSDWPQARQSTYVDVACIIHTGESKAAKEMAGEVICITLSQSSTGSFKSYQEKLEIKARAKARGIPGVQLPEDPFTFYFSTEAASKDGKDWTKLKVSTTQPTFE